MPPFKFLGPYRIGKQLGRGGMGTVYTAVHEKTGETVAVKLIASQVADEPRFRRRFDAEVKSLQRLRHPGIVRLIGFGEEEGQLFYSMELVDGESLQERLRREKKIDWRSVLDIAIQICGALKHAHDIGVIHRDLKPANLVLTADGSVKLVDFGIAKIFGDGEQTMAGSVLGTADYMAPEQATSTGITGRTDLYALGNVMYAMLTGRPPFTGKKITEVIESLKRDRPVPLDLVNPDLPEALVELVHQLLEKEPANRPPTALAVMNRLKAMRAGLQRESTVLADGSPTVELEDLGSRETNATGLLSDSESATDISDRKGEGEKKKTVVSKGGPGQNRGGGSGQNRVVDRQVATIVSGGSDSRTRLPDGSVAEDDDPPELKTHFQTVSEAGSSSGLFDEDARSTRGSLTQWIAISGMVVVLMIGCGLFLYAMRPPTADQLYESATTRDSGAMKTFLRRFPDDPRYDEVMDLHMANRLRGVLKRFTTQSKLAITPLTAAEEGFVSAMEGREQQPLPAIERLNSWLVVYDSPGNQQDPDLGEMIELRGTSEHSWGIGRRRSLSIRGPRV